MRNHAEKSYRDRSQKETHNEIERKRRERIKKETEYLQEQLANLCCHDKLSVFQQGAKELNECVERIGKRDYILTESEYSKMIIDTFPGFELHICCTDGHVLYVNDRVADFFGFTRDEMIGSSMKNFCDESDDSLGLLERCIHLTDAEKASLSRENPIHRNEILLVKVQRPLTEVKNPDYCILSTYEVTCKFMEVIGSIWNTDLGKYGTNSEFRDVQPVLRALCRDLKPLSASGISLDSHAAAVICKHHPTTFAVMEVEGEGVEDLFGGPAYSLINKSLDELFTADQKKQFRDAVSYEKASFTATLRGGVAIKVDVTALKPAGKCLFLLAKYTAYKQSVVFSLSSEEDDTEAVNHLEAAKLPSQSMSAEELSLVNKMSDASLSSCSSANSVRRSLQKKTDREPMEEWPDLNGFQELICEDKLFDELFDPPLLKELIQEDVTDVG